MVRSAPAIRGSRAPAEHLADRAAVAWWAPLASFSARKAPAANSVAGWSFPAQIGRILRCWAWAPSFGDWYWLQGGSGAARLRAGPKPYAEQAHGKKPAWRYRAEHPTALRTVRVLVSAKEAAAGETGRDHPTALTHRGTDTTTALCMQIQRLGVQVLRTRGMKIERWVLQDKT